MPNIAVLLTMGLVFCVSVVIADRLAKVYPKKQYLPIVGYLVGVAIIIALYIIGKNI